MNQKILAALSITAIILGVLNLALLLLLNPQISTDLNLPQEIPLESIGIDMQRVAPDNIIQFYRVSIYASIPDEPKTLYNCVFKMQYLTENDTWKTNTEYLGSVNFHNTEAYRGTVVLTLSFTLTMLLSFFCV